MLATNRSSTYSFYKKPQKSITLLEGLGVKGDIHAGKKVRHLFLIDQDKKKGVSRDNLRQVHLIQSEFFDWEGICAEDGTRLRPGQMGENITTIGIDLLGLGKGTILRFVKSVDDNDDVPDSSSVKGVLVIRLLQALCVVILAVAVLRHDKLWSIAALVALIALVSSYFAYDMTETAQDGTAVVELTGLRRPCGKIDKNVCKGLKDKLFIREDKKIIRFRAGVMGIVKMGGVVKPSMTIIVEPAPVFERMRDV